MGRIGALFGPRVPIPIISRYDVADAARSLPTSATWGRPDTLADHFSRHGSDFGFASAEDYAAKASQLLQDSQRNGYPTKIDPTDGTIRVFDPSTGTFGAYNADGTTKTLFKPKSPTYFDRQPGDRY